MDVCFLCTTEPAGTFGSLLIRPNEFPITSSHLLLAPEDHRAEAIESDVQQVLVQHFRYTCIFKHVMVSLLSDMR